MLTMVFWLIIGLSFALVIGFLGWLVTQIFRSAVTARYWAYYQDKYRVKPVLVRNSQAFLALVWRFFWGGFGANI